MHRLEGTGAWWLSIQEFEPENGTCCFSSSPAGVQIATLTFSGKTSQSSVLKHLIRQAKSKASSLITSVLL